MKTLESFWHGALPVSLPILPVVSTLEGGMMAKPKVVSIATKTMRGNRETA